MTRQRNQVPRLAEQVFTRHEVVDFILDLTDYSSSKPLHRQRLLEPSFGGGDFLLRAVARLLDAWSLTDGGKNMDGFTALVIDLVRANGLALAEIHPKRALLTLPGFFRPTKLWDLLVIHQGRLIAAIELKSQVGPSFGNNFNNRTEEAIGTAHDFWTAYREDAFGKHPRPLLGWLILVEHAPGARTGVRDRSPHFPVFPEFQAHRI